VSGSLISRPARLTAIALLGVAAVAAAIAANRGSFAGSVGTSEAAAASPLSAELARCRALGIAAQDDQGCRQAWRASRRQFLGQPRERAS